MIRNFFRATSLQITISLAQAGNGWSRSDVGPEELNVEPDECEAEEAYGAGWS